MITFSYLLYAVSRSNKAAVLLDTLSLYTSYFIVFYLTVDNRSLIS